MKIYKKTIFTFAIGFALLIQLANPTRARADDGTPPILPDDSAVTESSAPDELPALEDTSAADSAGAASTPANISSDQELTALETIQEIPVQTEIVVINETGEVIPLATQEAANIIAAGDPMWCPKANTSVTSACEYDATVGGLLAKLTLKDEDGVIYFYTPTSYAINDVFLDGINTDIDQLANNSLTLQGGWDGNTTPASTISYSGNSTFSVPVAVVNWFNAVTINNITVNGAEDVGILVHTAGDIKAEDVAVNGSIGFGYGAFLDNAHGTGSVTLTGANVFNDNDSNGLTVFSSGNIAAANITASGNSDVGAFLAASTGAGAIELTGANVFNNNQIGLVALSSGDIKAENITANGNSKLGAMLDNTEGTGGVMLIGVNVFNNNGNGLGVSSKSSITAENITANDNAGVGALFDNVGNLGAADGFGNVTLTGVNVFNNNGGNGLTIAINGNITVGGVAAENNGGEGIFLFTPRNAVVNGVSFLNNNPVDVNAFAVCGISELNIGGATYKLPVKGVHTFQYKSLFTDNDIEKRINCNPSVYLNGVLLNGEMQIQDFTSVILVDGVVEFNLDCGGQTVFDALLPNKDRVRIFCPVSGRARISRLENTTLPADLPAGYNYVSAFSLDIFQADGMSISYINEGGHVNVSFLVPSLQDGAAYSILYWDNGKWLPLKDFMLNENGEPRGFDLSDGDPRKILSGINIVFIDGLPHVEVSANFPGIFVLAQH